jgi:hypothetical protein
VQNQQIESCRPGAEQLHAARHYLFPPPLLTFDVMENHLFPTVNFQGDQHATQQHLMKISKK